MFAPTRRPALLLALLALGVSACSGPGAAAEGPDAPAEPEATYPAYESFDPAGYEAEPGPVVATGPAEVEHDVPASVMAGRVVVPGSSDPGPPPSDPEPETPATQVEGFRVQVYASESRESAERVRDDAVRWWRTTDRGAIEAIIAYVPPYYRVRLGAFASRAEADAALELVRREYPEAFLVPDVVPAGR